MTFPTDALHQTAETMIKFCGEAQAASFGYAEATGQSARAAWHGAEELARSMNSLMQESLARTFGICQTFASAKSPKDLADIHVAFLRDSFDGAVAGGGKVSEISIRAVKGAVGPLSQQMQDMLGTAMKRSRA